MSDFDDALRGADADIFAALGGKGVLQDPAGRRYIVQCVVDRDVEVLDDFGRVIAKRDYVAVIGPARCQPARGWKFETDERAWELDLPQESAGDVQTWSLR